MTLKPSIIGIQIGRLQAKDTPFGRESYTYSGLLLSSSTDVAGVKTHFKYDSFGRLIEKTCQNRKESIEYDAFGFPGRKSYFENELLLLTEVALYDALERTIENYVEDPTGLIFKHKKFEYDGDSNVVAEWDGDAKTKTAYDGNGRVSQVIDPYGVYKVNYTQTSVLKKEVIDPLKNKTITLYNAHHQEESVQQFNSDGDELFCRKYFYDLGDRLIREELTAGGVTQTFYRVYDSMGNETALIEPLCKKTRKTYSNAGQLETLTKPDGITLSHTYFKGRLATLTSSDNKLSYSYKYSPRGELISVKNEITSEISTQVFSDFGDLEEEQLPTGQQISYAYDGLGRITSYTLPDGGKVNTVYNAIAPISVQRFSPDGAIIYEHLYSGFNKRGAVTEEKLVGDGGTLQYIYNDTNQLKDLIHSDREQRDLTYDPVGNLLSYELNGKVYSFAYDPLYQLTHENDHHYTFDGFLNRL